MFNTATVSFELNSLLMHNGQLANPLNPIVKAMKTISGKRGKTDSDHEKLANLEFQGSLYLDHKLEKLVIPSMMLEAAIHAGAKKTKEGKNALEGLYVDTDAEISYDGGPLTVKELLASEEHRLVVPVNVQKSKVMRTRPYFTNVKGEFQVSFDDSIVTKEQLEKWLEAMVRQTGLGDWRPRHGRGKITGISYH